MNEHQNNLNYNQKYHNVVSKHINENNRHNTDQENVNKEYNLKKRLFSEIFYIKKQDSDALNEMTVLINYPICYDVIVNKI